jgi:hypothetical protein
VSDDLFIDGEGDPLGEDLQRHKSKKPKRRRTERLVGCPAAWFAWMFPLATSKEQVGLALYLYRRCCVCNSDTVTVPTHEVTELLDLSRWGKYRALLGLEKIGILQRQKNGAGTTKVRVCFWPDPPAP